MKLLSRFTVSFSLGDDPGIYTIRITALVNGKLVTRGIMVEANHFESMFDVLMDVARDEIKNYVREGEKAKP